MWWCATTGERREEWLATCLAGVAPAAVYKCVCMLAQRLGVCCTQATTLHFCNDRFGAVPNLLWCCRTQGHHARSTQIHDDSAYKRACQLSSTDNPQPYASSQTQPPTHSSQDFTHCRATPTATQLPDKQKSALLMQQAHSFASTIVAAPADCSAALTRSAPPGLPAVVPDNCCTLWVGRDPISAAGGCCARNPVSTGVRSGRTRCL